MERHDPHEPRPRRPAGGEDRDALASAHDALRTLEARLTRASAAAERLIAEAASQATARIEGSAPAASGAAPEATCSVRTDDDGGAAGRGRQPPASGWAPPEERHGYADNAGRNAEVLIEAVRALRGLIPPDLERRLSEALRELLLALRALIDWYIERLEGSPAQGAEVQDIPIL
jgi:hypothetical protein